MAGKRTPADPTIDQILAAMPAPYRELMGRMQAWTTRLVLAHADGQPERVAAIHTQIADWRRPIHDEASEPMPQWQSARRQATATFDDLRSLTSHALTRASRRQIGEGAARMIHDNGPATHAERLLAAAADFATGTPTTALDGLSEQQTDEATTLFYCAASGWLFNRVFPSRESGRLALTAKIREGEQIALGVPSPEWGLDIPDTAAIALLDEVLDLGPALLPPLDVARRHLLDHDLVSTAKLYLHAHPHPDESDLAALRTQLQSMIISFRVPEPEQVRRGVKRGPSETAFSTPKPGQRPERAKRKRRH